MLRKMLEVSLFKQEYCLFLEIHNINCYFLTGHSTVIFYHPQNARNVTVIAHEVTGDKTGIIKLMARQRLFVFIVESTHTYMDAPCGFHVEDYAEIVFPTEVILRGESSTINGRMTGVEKLVVERYGLVEFGGTSHTAKLPQEAQWLADNPFDPFTPGLITVPLLIITNTGVVRIKLTPVKAVLDIADTTVKKGEFVFYFSSKRSEGVYSNMLPLVPRDFRIVKWSF